MGASLLAENVWLAVAVCELFFILDMLAADAETRLYHQAAKPYLTIESIYDDDATSSGQRPEGLFTWRALVLLALLGAGVYAIWRVGARLHQPIIYAVLIGGLVLYKAANLVRRWRMISFFRCLRKEGGIQGSPSVSRQLVLTAHFNDLYSFSALYLLIFLLTGEWFFLGGSFTCLTAGRRWRDYTVMSKYFKR